MKDDFDINDLPEPRFGIGKGDPDKTSVNYQDSSPVKLVEDLARAFEFKVHYPDSLDDYRVDVKLDDVGYDEILDQLLRLLGYSWVRRDDEVFIFGGETCS